MTQTATGRNPSVGGVPRVLPAAAGRRLTMSEDELYALVVGTKSHPGLTMVYGWMTAHFRPAITAQGYRTAVSADGKGYPDLTLVRGSRIIVAELKTDVGVVSEEQNAWLDRFAETCAETYVWRPLHWHNGAILEVLKR